MFHGQCRLPFRSLNRFSRWECQVVVTFMTQIISPASTSVEESLLVHLTSILDLLLSTGKINTSNTPPPTLNASIPAKKFGENSFVRWPTFCLGKPVLCWRWKIVNSQQHIYIFTTRRKYIVVFTSVINYFYLKWSTNGVRYFTFVSTLILGLSKNFWAKRRYLRTQYTCCLHRYPT